MALYARPYLLVSLLIDVAVLLLLAGWGADDSMDMPDYVPMMTMLKIVSVAIVLFLFAQLSSESKKYFYINLGLSPRKLLGLAVLLDLAFYFVGLLIICLVYA